MVDYLDEEFKALAEALLKKFHVPGISVAVFDHGKVSAKGYGLARLPNVPATADTLYYAGSTTKAMLAATLGIAIHDVDKVKHGLKDKELLSWSTPLKSVLGEDFALEDSCASQNTTIEDALSHRCGLSGHDNFYGPYIGDSCSDITKRVKYLGPLTKQFRNGFQYNNVMYAVAGDLLERVSGLACGHAIENWLWKPLGMNRSFWHLKEVLSSSNVKVAKDMSRGYYWVGSQATADASESEQGYYVPERFIDLAGIAPAGAVISSVLEYATWIKAILEAAAQTKDASEGPNKIRCGLLSLSDSPMSPQLFKDVSTPRITVPVPELGGALPNTQLIPSLYSLGWAIPPSALGAFHPIMAHPGGLNGYGTSLILLPNDNFGVVIMGNTAGTSNAVGAFLGNELIARRIGLKSRDKEQELKTFKEVMAMTWPPSSDAEDPGIDISNKDASLRSVTNTGSLLDLDDFINKYSQNFPSLRHYEGIYRNAAYGDFRVSLTPASYDYDVQGESIRLRHIVYRSKERAENAVKDKIRANLLSLQVDAVGKRTWKFSYLLHPRKPSSSSSIGQDFDQEYLWGHGYTEEDVVAGVPTGAEDCKPDGICRKENAWESLTWTRLGAAIVQDKALKENPNSGKNQPKLGMTLANELLASEANREQGWQSKMIWFEKASSSTN